MCCVPLPFADQPIMFGRTINNRRLIRGAVSSGRNRSERTPNVVYSSSVCLRSLGTRRLVPPTTRTGKHRVIVCVTTRNKNKKISKGGRRSEKGNLMYARAR